MDRISTVDLGDPVSRYGEMDRAVNRSAIAVTVAAALLSLPFWSRDPTLAYAGWIPLTMRGIRYLLVRDERSLYRWAHCNAYTSGGAVVLSASVSGGLDSPVVIFTIVVGIMTSMLFAHQPLWSAYPLAMVATIAGIDWLNNGLAGVDWLAPVSVAIVALAVPRLVTDMVSVELAYREKAVLDPLTGCLNRTSMTGRLTELEHQASQMADYVGVIAIDIDHFKSINDRHGHAVGDQVLQQVAYGIRRNLRRFELLYRTGGEEFVLLLPGAPPDVTYRLGETIRRSVAGEQFDVGQVTISVGTVSERAPEDLPALIARADQLMLEAKQGGRNRTVQASA